MIAHYRFSKRVGKANMPTYSWDMAFKVRDTKLVNWEGAHRNGIGSIVYIPNGMKKRIPYTISHMQCYLNATKQDSFVSTCPILIFPPIYLVMS